MNIIEFGIMSTASNAQTSTYDGLSEAIKYVLNDDTVYPFVSKLISPQPVSQEVIRCPTLVGAVTMPAFYKLNIDTSSMDDMQRRAARKLKDAILSKTTFREAYLLDRPWIEPELHERSRRGVALSLLHRMVTQRRFIGITTPNALSENRIIAEIAKRYANYMALTCIECSSHTETKSMDTRRGHRTFKAHFISRASPVIADLYGYHAGVYYLCEVNSIDVFVGIAEHIFRYNILDPENALAFELWDLTDPLCLSPFSDTVTYKQLVIPPGCTRNAELADRTRQLVDFVHLFWDHVHTVIRCSRILTWIANVPDADIDFDENFDDYFDDYFGDLDHVYIPHADVLDKLSHPFSAIISDDWFVIPDDEDASRCSTCFTGRASYVCQECKYQMCAACLIRVLKYDGRCPYCGCRDDNGLHVIEIATVNEVGKREHYDIDLDVPSIDISVYIVDRDPSERPSSNVTETDLCIVEIGSVYRMLDSLYAQASHSASKRKLISNLHRTPLLQLGEGPRNSAADGFELYSFNGYMADELNDIFAQ